MSNRNLKPLPFCELPIGQKFFVGPHSWTPYFKENCGQASVPGENPELGMTTFTGSYACWVDAGKREPSEG